MDSTRHSPGQDWAEILSRPTLKAFALAFTAAPRLDAYGRDLRCHPRRPVGPQ